MTGPGRHSEAGVRAHLHPGTLSTRAKELAFNAVARLAADGGKMAVVTSESNAVLQVWSDGDLTIVTDHPFRCDRYRVFPVFDDENLVLRRLSSQLKPARVLDIGTGSGILAIAAAQAGAIVVATEINDRALEFARVNAGLNGVSDRVHFERQDIFPKKAVKFDLIISNPPFVPNPLGGAVHIASDGGWNGAAMIRRLLAKARSFLAPNGMLMMTAMSLQRDSVPYVLSLATEFLRSDFEISIQPIYRSPLPLDTYTALFSRFSQAAHWGRRLSKRGFDSLAYFVLTAGHVPISVSPAVTTVTPLSGTWSSRLTRYHHWLDQL